MAYRIKINKKFEIESQKVYQYLAEEWSFKAADDFIENLYARIDQLSEVPLSGSPASRHKNVRKITLSKHNKVYYRVKGRTITVLSLFESKKDPKKNKYG
jgi:plasmid stabilization system protein ParE